MGTNKTVTSVSLTRKKFSFKTSRLCSQPNLHKIFPVSKRSLNYEARIYSWRFVFACLLICTLSVSAPCLAWSTLITASFASNLINMATDAARLIRYPECNNPHVLICMQFIVNLSAPCLPPVYSLISNEGIKTPSLIVRHLKQRIYKPSQLWLHFSRFRTASKGGKVWKWMIWWQAALKIQSES